MKDVVQIYFGATPPTPHYYCPGYAWKRLKVKPSYLPEKSNKKVVVYLAANAFIIIGYKLMILSQPPAWYYRYLECVLSTELVKRLNIKSWSQLYVCIIRY